MFFAQMDGDVRSSSDEISDSSVDNGLSQQANGTGKQPIGTTATDTPVAAAQQNGTPKKHRAEENGNAASASPQSDYSTPLTAQ